MTRPARGDRRCSSTARRVLRQVRGHLRPAALLSRSCSPSMPAGPDHMPIRPGKPVPGLPAPLRHHLDARLAGQGGLGDGLRQRATSSRRLKELHRPRARSAAVEGLWVTHYHDDHVDGDPRSSRRRSTARASPTAHVAEVITDPLAWRLPCISPSEARVDRPHAGRRVVAVARVQADGLLTSPARRSTTRACWSKAGRCGCSSSATRSPWRASTTTARTTATGSGRGVGLRPLPRPDRASCGPRTSSTAT